MSLGSGTICPKYLAPYRRNIQLILFQKTNQLGNRAIRHVKMGIDELFKFVILLKVLHFFRDKTLNGVLNHLIQEFSLACGVKIAVIVYRIIQHLYIVIGSNLPLNIIKQRMRNILQNLPVIINVIQDCCRNGKDAPLF